MKTKFYDGIKLLKSVLTTRHIWVNRGWTNSIRVGRPIDKNSNPLPWLTYSATRYLDNLDLLNRKVVEFGSGYSSIWWKSRGVKLTSVEDDPNWIAELESFSDIQISMINNVNEPDSYKLFLDGKTEIVVIDGLNRRLAANVIIELIKQNELPNLCMLIFDNSDWFLDDILYLDKHLGMLRIDFVGSGPINTYEWTTSIFLKPNSPVFNSLKSVAVGDWIIKPE